MKSIWLFLLILFLNCTEFGDEDDSINYTQEPIPWPSLADSPWPMFRHDPQGTGRSQYIGPQLGEIVSSITDTFYMEESAVIDEDENIFITAPKNDTTFLYAFGPNGIILWKTPLETGQYTTSYSTPVIASNGNIYVTSYTSSNTRSSIHAIDSAGTETWRYTVYGENIGSSLNIDKEGNLYLILSESSRLISLTSIGSLRWEMIIPGISAYSLPGVFSPNGENFYLGSPDSLYAISTDGEIKWSYFSNGYFLLPLVDNQGNIYSCNNNDNTIKSVNEVGEINWQIDYEQIGTAYIESIVAPTMDYNGNIYFAGSNPILISIDSNEGIVNWTLPLTARVETSLVSDVNSNIYFADRNNNILGVSSDGEILFQTIELIISGQMADSPAIGKEGKAYFSVEGNNIKPILVIR